MNPIETLGVSTPSFVSGSKKLFIGGEWLEPASGREFGAVNPATGEVLAHIAQGDGIDVDRAVRAARQAFEGEWSKWSPFDRQRLLLRVHDVIEKNFDELALIETLDMGSPLSRTRGLKNWVSQLILFYASQTGSASTESLRSSIGGQFTAKIKAPIGVVGGIIPWNGPIMSQWYILGPVLATGCTAVLKPAEDASLTVLRVAELLTEAGVPDGVVNIVTGSGASAGAALAAHPDVNRLSFTGSTETGRKIIEASAGNIKRIQLELGGKSPDIVFGDANLDIAVPGTAMGVFGNSGQFCTAGTRLYVQNNIHDEFLDRLQVFSNSLKTGNGLDADVDLGPLISQKQLDRVSRYIEIGQREGAKLVTGGKVETGISATAGGFFVEPTVFSGVENSMTIAREEIFGPVISVIPFEDEEEALRLANDTDYGLAGGVWTESFSTAHKMVEGIQAGTIWVNCYGALDPAVGFGGYKTSGYGWKGGPEHVESFLYQKAAYMNIG
ncbi:aldehyde dehydrogenase family protein [Rhodococcus sp. WS1]|uniref:aldehyde dehydrogenase family protein n=1 Tax=unclassified Rhodococcus (in: high G+C Gram-positive bacteria) TaxID=192944 RepID=UPI001141CE95|nr:MULTISPECIES: aldehyde dehydrogenase family protein [unclassified Rhodococcus (in: high G+C Gram-positive bacteria)]ROZ53018.1 aldehyde dehydrogenase family protein [Rhodococcus sp. WS1]TQC35960.1 aldehyde dehydrogenase family protein [Rhodococcus sp. WS7]